MHKPTKVVFHPFTGTNKTLLLELQKDMVGRLSLLFTRKSVVDEIFTRNSTNLCKSIVGYDASQLYPYSKVSANTHWFFYYTGLLQ